MLKLTYFFTLLRLWVQLDKVVFVYYHYIRKHLWLLMNKKVVLKKPLVFDWDKGNEKKNVTKHNVQNNETEEVFFNDPVIIYNDSHSQVENRYLVYGVTNKGRQLVISFTLRGEQQERIRPIMSRDQDKKERLYYQKQKGGVKNI